ncbi:MAG TPA: hypothetical protein PK303_06530 [bacterium]|nr:hypothetical protein [bacterium]HPP08756.1 hypothetical protein [bacterium]
MLIVFSLLLTLFATKIYQWIELESITSLEQFIEQSPINEDLKNIFGELLEKTDEEIKKDFRFSSADLMNLFAKKIDEGIEKEENITCINSILETFRNTFGKRSLQGVVNSDFLKKFFKWYLKAWKEYRVLRGEFIDNFSLLQYIFEDLVRRVLREEPSHCYEFFAKFKEHIDISLKEKVKVNGREDHYVKILKNFGNVFFEEVCKPPYHDQIWEAFPDEWKITAKHLQKEDGGIISRIFFLIFFGWAQQRTKGCSEERFDECLEKVAKELFPEVEPRLWASVLIFVISPYTSKEKRVEDVVNIPWTFGYIGREFDYVVDDEGEKDVLKNMFGEYYKKQEEEKEETIKLAELLFGKILSKEKIEKYLEEIKTLENQYDRNDIRYYRLQRLKLIFELLLKQ